MAADEKLSEAMTEMVREEVARATGKPAPHQRKPRKRDVIVFVVFAANLALLMWSLPSEFLKSEQWEFYEKLIPAVGGSLFTLIAAWFKEKTLEVIQSKWFQWAQIPLGVVALLLGAPVLPIQVKVLPADASAILYVDKDDQDHFRDWKKTVWLSFAEHDVIAKHYDRAHWNDRRFHWTRRDLARMLWHHHEVELPVLYDVRVDLPEPGLTVNVRKIGTEFDEDFLHADNMAQHHLTEIDGHKLTLTPATSGDVSPVPKLPAGQYELSASKTGCMAGPTATLIVPPATNPESCEVEVEPAKCAKP